jgi:ribosomal protein S14
LHNQDNIFEEIDYRFALKLYEQHNLSKLTMPVLRQETLKICTLSGRARGFIARFRLARTTFRKLIKAGTIPGERKSSF